MKSFLSFISEVKAKKLPDSTAWANETDPCKQIFQTKLFQAIAGGTEKDTPREEDIWGHVSNYVASPERYANVKAAYTDLLRCKATYKQQLDPNVKTIYRGINISLKNALKMVDFNKLDQTIKIGSKQMIGNATKYIPKHSIESWSANPNIAIKFATGKMAEVPNYSFGGLAELKKDVNQLKKLIARSEKLKNLPKDKRGEDHAFDRQEVNWDIKWHIQDNINNYLASDSPIPVVYQITPDKYCVMNPLFSNKIASHVNVKNEFEVTRIETNPIAATVWIPQEIVEAAKLIAEIQELIKQAGIKTPKIKVAVPVTLKKGK